MTLRLNDVVLWGRSLDEYQRMFALRDVELDQRILGCADGPASFNAELRQRGLTAVSCDPIYRFSVAEIRSRIGATAGQLIDYTRQNGHEFVWSDQIPDPDALALERMAAMNRFLHDFESGKTQARYVAAELPSLPFPDAAFDIAVCSHLLFLYGAQLSEQFHLDSVRSLVRVAHQVRIFPLTELSSQPSRHIEPVTQALRAEGHRVSIVDVDYEFQRGANQMMTIIR